jgi:hypothetical protein
MLIVLLDAGTRVCATEVSKLEVGDFFTRSMLTEVFEATEVVELED